MIKKIVIVSLALMTGSTYARSDDQKADAVDIESSATAVDSLAVGIPGISRGIIDEAYQKIEQTLDPKTYDALRALEQRTHELQGQRASLLELPYYTEQSKEIKKIDAELYLIGRDLEDLIRQGGALHWRTFLALGLGMSVGTFAWRVSSHDKSTWCKSKRALYWGLLTTVVMEFLLRGRHALIGGYMYQGIAGLFHIIKKTISRLTGRAGIGERIVSALEDALHPISSKIDVALTKPYGMLAAVGITAAAIGLVVLVTPQSKTSEGKKA